MKITVFGLGAIGSNLLVQLSKQYPDFEYVGVDFDKVEERNLRTQAYFLEHVGAPKVQAMRVVLSRHLRKPKYTPVQRKIEPSDLNTSSKGLGGLISDLWIDCFDNSESRELLRVAGSNEKILFSGTVPTLHVGFSPLYTAECIWNENYEVPGNVDPRMADICSMTDAVGFIHLTVNAALLNISQYLESKPDCNGRRHGHDFLITNKSKITWI
jgi:molybdopterin/thiamine biosynthesis adenylyltransferase